jgi:hypothetical protein
MTHLSHTCNHIAMLSIVCCVPPPTPEEDMIGSHICMLPHPRSPFSSNPHPHHILLQYSSPSYNIFPLLSLLFKANFPSPFPKFGHICPIFCSHFPLFFPLLFCPNFPSYFFNFVPISVPVLFFSQFSPLLSPSLFTFPP